MTSPDPVHEEAWNAELRLPDELNPVLLRETQSLYKGRIFPIFLVLSLASMVFASGVFLFEFSPRGSNGLDFLNVTLWFLAPVVLVLIPLQAAQSVSEELREGMGSVLLMSSMSPARIISGKIQASLLQLGVALGLFSPLLGIAYMLRGTDALLIGGLLIASVLGNLLATTFVVGLSAQAAVLKRPILTALIIVGGLGGLTLAFLAQLDWILVYAPMIVSALLTPRGMAIWISIYMALLILSWLIGTSALTHPNENRATAFRIFHTVALLWSLALIFVFVRSRDWDFSIMIWCIVGATCSIPFFFAASTDPLRLSPRVRAHVPGRAPLLVTLFLPGSGRGLMYACAWSSIFGMAAAIASLGHTYGYETNLLVLTGILLYTLLYCSLACFVRSRLPLHISRNWITRLLILLLVGLVCFVPLLIQAPFGHMEWNILHIGNPFWTIAHVEARREVGPLVVAGILVAFLLHANRTNLLGSWREIRDLVPARRRQS